MTSWRRNEAISDGAALREWSIRKVDVLPRPARPAGVYRVVREGRCWSLDAGGWTGTDGGPWTLAAEHWTVGHPALDRQTLGQVLEFGLYGGQPLVA